MAQFNDLLSARWDAGASISVGLDVTPKTLPPVLSGRGEEGVIAYLSSIIEKTKDLAAAWKPQIAGFEAMGDRGMPLLREIIAAAHDLAPQVPVILDAKRGDIGNTNKSYVTAAFEYLNADAITVAPYMGPETMAPFLDRDDKGVIILCRTSNPGAGQYQDLLVDGVPLYQVVARDVVETWNRNGNCGLVVGATYPAELAEVRAIVGELPILVPGLGAQGGDLEATVRAGESSPGRGLLLHATRSILNAWQNAPDQSPDGSAAFETQRMHDQIVAARG